MRLQANLFSFSWRVCVFRPSQISQKILHSSRLALLKLQEGLLLFKPVPSESDKEISQAVLIILHIRRTGKACSEEGTELLSDCLILAMGFRCHREAQGGSNPHTDSEIAHHNITEPRNGSDRKEPKDHWVPNPCHWLGHLPLEQVSQRPLDTSKDMVSTAGLDNSFYGISIKTRIKIAIVISSKGLR